MRRSVWKLIFAATAASGLLAFISANSFAEYIPEPVLIEVTPLNPPVTEEVIVDLTASPQEGFAPLEVTFTCTAKAVVHYADERWAMPPQGSVTRTEPLYETVTANITEQPADQTIEKVGNHPFKATAEHGGVTGEGFTTVVVKKPNCAELLRIKEDLEKELSALRMELSNLQFELDELNHKIDKLKSLKNLSKAGRDEIGMKLSDLKIRRMEIITKIYSLSRKIETMSSIDAEEFAYIAQLKQELKDLEKENKKTEQGISRLEDKLDAADRAIAFYERSLKKAVEDLKRKEEEIEKKELAIEGTKELIARVAKLIEETCK